MPRTGAPPMIPETPTTVFAAVASRMAIVNGVGAVLTFLRCWTVLYGAVAMEVFGHMRFALEDPAPMFELTLGDLAALVGLRYLARA